VTTFAAALERARSLSPESLEEYRARKHREDAEIRAGLLARDRQRQLDVLRRECNLGERFSSRTFATWRSSPETNEALAAASTVAESWRQGVWLYGPVGTGKTHLLAAITNAAIEAEVTATFTTSIALLERIRRTYERDGVVREGESDIIARYVDVDVLAIDDIGKERMTGWAAEKIFELVNRRYEADKPICLTSNLPPEQLAEHWRSRDMDPTLGVAITRRLVEMAGTIVNM
jgi:DNA replication protein DnaC